MIGKKIYPSREFVKAATSGGVIKAAGLVVNFLFLMAFARAMSAGDFGYLGTALSLGTILTSILGLGYPDTMLKNIPRELANSNDRGVIELIASAIARIFFVSSILFLALLLLGSALKSFPRYFSFENRYLEFLAFTVLLGTGLAIAEVFAASLRSLRSNFGALLPREVFWRVLCIAALLAGLRPNIIEALSLIVGLLCAVIVVQGIFLWVKLPSRDWKVWRRYDSTSGRFWAISTLQVLTANVGTIIVASLIGPIEAGIFFVADRIAKLTGFGLVATNLTTSPEMSRAYARNDLKAVAKLLVFASMAAFGFWLLCAGLVAFLPEEILALFNPEYVSGSSALLIFTLSQGVNSATGPHSVLLKMTGNEDGLVRTTIIWSVLTVALTTIGALTAGLLGAATATAGSRLGQSIAVARISKKRLNAPIFPFLAKRKFKTIKQ